MVKKKNSYTAFSDESGTNGNSGLSSIAFVSLPSGMHGIYDIDLQEILGNHEFKWNKCNSNDEIVYGQKIIDWILQTNCLRIDVIYWDKQDKFLKCNSKASLRKMYTQIAKWITSCRWQDNIQGYYPQYWTLIPDCNSAMNFELLQKYCQMESWKNAYNNGYKKIPNCKFNSRPIEVSSGEYRMIQVADLFAGLVIFTAKEICNYKLWKEGKPINLSKITQLRMRLVDSLLNSFEIDENLIQTCPNAKPLNIWHYDFSKELVHQKNKKLVIAK